MKTFDRIFICTILLSVLFILGVNIYFLSEEQAPAGRPYRVEVERIAYAVEKDGVETVDLTKCTYVTGVYEYHADEAAFFETDSDYVIREIDGIIYRFDYRIAADESSRKYLPVINLTLGIMAAMLIFVMLFIRIKILLPFQKMTDVPYELSRGNLTVSIKESRSRFFGRFAWGVDMLREYMESQKQRELELQKEKKTLLLSISHDIKTPLSAIKLYAKALSKGLYADRETQVQIAERIDVKADEIEGFVSQIVGASREDFLDFSVNMGEFYLSELIREISVYYEEKLALVKTDFVVNAYADCLLKGDMDRSVEVLQNIMENAIKYGDGRKIELSVSEEDGCQLLTIENSGGTLLENELPHIFESFYRGANAEHLKGSGLGLYICRQLMQKMGGEIFAEIRDGAVALTVVFGEV